MIRYRKNGSLSIASLSTKEREAAIAVLVHGERGANAAIAKYKSLVDAGDTDIGVHGAYKYWLDVLGAYKQLRSQVETVGRKNALNESEFLDG